MITFRGGPAEGQALLCRAAPLYLRVVQGPDGAWDALDQPHDMPRLGEKVYLYRLVPDCLVGWIHLRQRKGSGTYVVAEYEFVEPQPSEETLRGIRAWKQWLAERRAK